MTVLLALAGGRPMLANPADPQEQPASREALARSRPLGLNCDHARAPEGAGENGGHGVVVLVHPRRGDIRASYSGCQAVFARSAGQPDRLVWLVEISRGQPVRLWTADPLLQELLACRYQAGALTRGDARVCPTAATLLMPSQPAGCFTAEQGPAECEFDSP